MPDYTITLTDSLDAKVAELVTEHNNRTGAKLTIPDWLLLFLRERAVQPAMAEEIEALEKKSQRDLNAAIVAKKGELMDALSVDSPASPPVI
jgi:hypothetical protein